MPTRIIPVSSRLGLLLLTAYGIARGQGFGGIYTTPPGGEGATAVALGVALPGGLPSMEVNPALLAWEGDRTSSTLQLSTFEGNLYPRFFENRLHDEDLGAGLRYPIRPGTDIALGYSWRRQTLAPDTTGAAFGEETLQHVVLAGRFANMVSVGVGWKWLDSRSSAMDDSGRAYPVTAQHGSWDLGILVAPRWRILETPLRVGPSFGFSESNVSKDSLDYGAQAGHIPVDRERRWGLAGELSAPDLFSIQIFQDEVVNLSGSTYDAYESYQGYSLDVLGLLRWSFAHRANFGETHVAWQATADLKHLCRLAWRIRNSEYGQLIGDEPELYPFPTWTVLGATFCPNIRVAFTYSKIEGTTWITNGQRRVEWAVSL